MLQSHHGASAAAISLMNTFSVSESPISFQRESGVESG
jgi:hypothetical protein